MPPGTLATPYCAIARNRPLETEHVHNRSVCNGSVMNAVCCEHASGMNESVKNWSVINKVYHEQVCNKHGLFRTLSGYELSVLNRFNLN